MKIELESGGLRLAHGQILKVLNGAGATILARDGTVWITEEGQERDIVLDAGSCYRLRHRGVAVVNALSGDANITLQP